MLWIDYDDDKKLIFYVVEEVSLYVNKWPGGAKPDPACNSRWANEPWLMLMTKPTQGFRVHQCSSAEFTTNATKTEKRHRPRCMRVEHPSFDAYVIEKSSKNKVRSEQKEKMKLAPPGFEPRSAEHGRIMLRRMKTSTCLVRYSSYVSDVLTPAP